MATCLARTRSFGSSNAALRLGKISNRKPRHICQTANRKSLFCLVIAWRERLGRHCRRGATARFAVRVISQDSRRSGIAAPHPSQLYILVHSCEPKSRAVRQYGFRVPRSAPAVDLLRPVRQIDPMSSAPPSQVGKRSTTAMDGPHIDCQPQPHSAFAGDNSPYFGRWSSTCRKARSLDPLACGHGVDRLHKQHPDGIGPLCGHSQLLQPDASGRSFVATGSPAQWITNANRNQSRKSLRDHTYNEGRRSHDHRRTDGIP